MLLLHPPLPEHYELELPAHLEGPVPGLPPGARCPGVLDVLVLRLRRDFRSDPAPDAAAVLLRLLHLLDGGAPQRFRLKRGLLPSDPDPEQCCGRSGVLRGRHHFEEQPRRDHCGGELDTGVVPLRQLPHRPRKAAARPELDLGHLLHQLRVRGPHHQRIFWGRPGLPAVDGHPRPAAPPGDGDAGAGIFRLRRGKLRRRPRVDFLHLRSARHPVLQLPAAHELILHERGQDELVPPAQLGGVSAAVRGRCIGRGGV